MCCSYLMDHSIEHNNNNTECDIDLSSYYMTIFPYKVCMIETALIFEDKFIKYRKANNVCISYEADGYNYVKSGSIFINTPYERLLITVRYLINRIIRM